MAHSAGPLPSYPQQRLDKFTKKVVWQKGLIGAIQMSIHRIWSHSEFGFGV